MRKANRSQAIAVVRGAELRVGNPPRLNVVIAGIRTDHYFAQEIEGIRELRRYEKIEPAFLERNVRRHTKRRDERVCSLARAKVEIKEAANFELGSEPGIGT